MDLLETNGEPIPPRFNLYWIQFPVPWDEGWLKISGLINTLVKNIQGQPRIGGIGIFA